MPIGKALRGVFPGWWVLAAGSVIQSVGNGLLWFGSTVFFLPVLQDMGVSRAVLSLVFAARSLEGGLEGPLVGWLIDRFGPRWLVLAGVSIAGLGLILLALAPSFVVFVFIYVMLVGMGYNAGFFAPISTALNSWFIRRRGLVLGILSAAGGVGGVVLVPLLSYMVLSFGWRWASVVSGLIILVVCIPLALPIYRSPESRGLQPDGISPQGGTDSAVVPMPASADFSVGEAVRTVSYWLLAVTITLRVGVTQAVVLHMVPILVWKGLDEVTAAFLVGLFAFLHVPAPLFLGWLGDRWSKTMISALGAFSGLVGLVLLLFTQGASSGYILAISLALIMGTTALNWALIGDFFGRRYYATLRGIMGLVYCISTFSAPIYAGWVFDRTGSYEEALVVFSIILAVVTVLFALLRHPAPLKELVPGASRLR
ncbi:MAG: MFS transporter [Chloroflexota bacterium]|nr:MFS transporter [Chloroflexota bacterium]